MLSAIKSYLNKCHKVVAPGDLTASSFMASFSYRSTTREEDAMKITTLEDRLHIVELARTGHTAAQIAAQTGWSLATIRKWQRRIRQQGRAALSSALGRPTRGALSAFPPE